MNLFLSFFAASMGIVCAILIYDFVVVLFKTYKMNQIKRGLQAILDQIKSGIEVKKVTAEDLEDLLKDNDQDNWEM